MTTETTEEKTVETTTPSAPEPSAELVTLRQQLTEKESALVEATERARKHEQAATRNANKLQEQQRRLGEIADLKNEVGVIRDAVFDLLDSGALTEEQTPRRRSDQYRDKLKTETPKPEVPQYSTDFLDKAQEAEELAKSIGLDMSKSKELRAARMAFRDGDADDGLDEVKKVVESKRQSPKTEVKSVEAPKKTELTDEQKEEIAREYMERKGLLTVDIGMPSTISRTDADIEKAYADGNITTSEYNAYLRKRQK